LILVFESGLKRPREISNPLSQKRDKKLVLKKPQGSKKKLPKEEEQRQRK